MATLVKAVDGAGAERLLKQLIRLLEADGGILAQGLTVTLHALLDVVVNGERADSLPLEKASSKLKILVVTAKLLTDFDAPICYCMYLDKPLRDHTLLQAMCRTNRLYTDAKKYGLIIDYLGVFENVAKTLDYDPKEIEGVVESIEKFKELFPQAMQKCLDYFPGVGRNIEGYEG